MAGPTARIAAATVIISAVLAATFATPALAQPTPTLANVPYGDGHPRQVLDVYIPSGPPVPRPAVVWIHGGGWKSGDRSSAPGRAAGLLQRGFVVVAINYRYSQQAPFPAQIHDCKAAIRHLRTNAASYRIDPDRIGVWGPSAGGHLAALIGTSGDVADAEGAVGGNLGHSSRVQAVADYFGPADFFEVDGWQTQCTSPPQSVSQLLGRCLGEIQANRDNPAWASWVNLALLASPTTHVSSDDPPFHIAHGTADPVVWPEHSVLLHDALANAAVPVTLRMAAGFGHELPSSEDVFVREFFAAQLGNTSCPADLNNDRVVDSSDISLFVLMWIMSLNVGSLGGDFDGSGAINSSDISAYLTEWLAAIADGC